jgi:hypothetical protein
MLCRHKHHAGALFIAVLPQRLQIDLLLLPLCCRRRRRRLAILSLLLRFIVTAAGTAVVR